MVIHLGADPGDDGSWDSLLNNNLVGTYNVFEASREASVQRVVAASSIMVYEYYGDAAGPSARGYFLPFRNSPMNVLRTR